MGRVGGMATIAVLGAVLGCGEAETVDGAASGSGGSCVFVRRDVPLDGILRETSGAAFDPERTDLFWTHNDSGHDPEVFAVGFDGALVGRIRVAAARNQDWEDMAVGPCPEGGPCLFLFDIGDSDRKRGDAVELYRLPLPRPEATATSDAVRMRARFPGGNRDAEAAFVLPDGSVYLVNKGPRHPIELWRWPAGDEGGAVELERVRTLAPEPDQPGDRVTGAAASPDGGWVAIRTYGRLAFYRTGELLADGGPAFTVDLALLGEPQGEAVALRDDGTVLLTSESGSRALPPRATLLRCRLP